MQPHRTLETKRAKNKSNSSHKAICYVIHSKEYDRALTPVMIRRLEYRLLTALSISETNQSVDFLIEVHENDLGWLD